MATINEGEVQYGDIEGAYVAAKLDVDTTDNIDVWARDSLTALSGAKVDQEKVEAVKSLFKWPGLRLFIEFMFYRSLLADRVPATPDDQKANLLVVPSDENGGCLIVVFPDSLGHLGDSFKRDRWREENLKPLVDAIRFLDTAYLISVLERVPGLAIKQREISRQILEKVSPIREDHSIWVSKCTLVNYGNSPLIVWPDAYLLLKKKGTKRLKIPCYLAEEKKDNEDDATDLAGPIVLPPGNTARLWAVTRDTKQKMADGNLVNAYFKDKSATGRTRLLVTQRGIPFKTSCKSTTLLFAEAKVREGPTSRSS